MLRRGARHLLVFAAMILLAVIHTWPLIPLRKTHIIDGIREDTWLNVWHINWWRDSVVHWHSPFFAPQLHYPLGAELYWHMMAPSKSLWGLALPWFDIIELQNLVMFWTFPLAGMTAWWLVRDVLRRGGHSGTTSDVAAFAGACVFTFSRYHLCHAHAHGNLSGMEGIPLYIFVVLRYFEERKPRWLIGSTFAALYVAGCDLYYLYYVALFFVIWLVSTIWRDSTRLFDRANLRHPLVRPAVAIAIASGIGVLPIVLPILSHMNPAPLSIHGDSMYPTDPLLFVVPDKLSRWTFLMPSGMAHAFSKLQNGILNDLDGGVFLGYATIALAVVAYRAEGGKLRPWLDAGVVFFLLSFGSYLNIGGVDTLPPEIVLAFVAAGLWSIKAVRANVRSREALGLLVLLIVLSRLGAMASHDALNVRFPMPYMFFKHVAPLFSRGGMPVRFTVMLELALAVVVPFGVLALARRVDPRWAFAAVLAVNIDTLGKPMPMDEMKPLPAAFDQIRDDHEEVAVYSDHVLAQWEMLHHHRPISFARQSRIPVHELPLIDSPLDQALVEFDFTHTSESDVAAMKAALRAGHFKYFVGHHRHATEFIRWKKLAPDIDAQRTRFVTETLGGHIIHDDADYQVVQFW